MVCPNSTHALNADNAFSLMQCKTQWTLSLLIIAIINAFIYRKELRQQALTSSQNQLDSVLNQLIAYCTDRNFRHDEKIIEIFTRLVALLTSSNSEEIQMLR